MMLTLPYVLAGRAESPNADLVVLDKYRGEVFARVAAPDAAAVDRAIDAAVAAAAPLRRLPSHRRQASLRHVAERLAGDADRFARVLVRETGKTIHEARVEVARAIETFTRSAEEATRIGGEYLPLDLSSRSEGLRAITRRVPVGPCSFITPFNFPLNLAAHKVGPALAAGCPFILKPDPRTPVTSIMLGEILAEADLPPGSFSMLPVVKDGLNLLSEDERLRLLSFTGSPAVGWMLRSRAGRKKVTLELGGNAACVVDDTVDVSVAAARLVTGAFAQAGQSCISVQRIIAHETILDDLRERLLGRIASLRMGDPMEESTTLGPMISEGEARRVETWVQEAVEGGARVLCGGERQGSFFQPTLLERVDAAAKVSCREVFGPVATLEGFRDFDAALRRVNDSDYGLQAGLFTRDIHRAFRALDELEVGGVVINDVPSTRVDSMPYGGVKASGLGREGVRYAIEDMTEIRVMVLSRVGGSVGGGAGSGG